MRLPSIGAIACLVCGCRPTSPQPTVGATTTVPGTNEAKDADELPPLPPDLQASLGEAYGAVQARHAEPKPALEEPLATVAEHQAWVDGTLEPWRGGLREVGMSLDAARPSMPDIEATDAHIETWERAQFVHAALSATMALDESIARVRIPFPRDVQQTRSARAELKEYVERVLGHELDTAALWLGACTEYASGEEPVPPDLEPWASHCQGMIDDLVSSVCSAEKRVDLEPSVFCSGERRYPRAGDAPGGSGASTQELVALTEQTLELCFVAQDIVEDSSVVPERKLSEWRSRLAGQGIDASVLLTVIDEALEVRGAAAAYAKLRDGMQLRSPVPGWECAALRTLLEARTGAGP